MVKFIKQFFIIITALLSVISFANAGTQYHVAVNGTNNGAGTLASPWSIQRGLDVTASPHAAGGDTVWIHGGVYTSTLMNDPNTFQFELAGTSDALPVIIRNWNNERVVWQGNAAEVAVYHGGQYSWLWGIEITSIRQPAGDNSGYLMTGYHNKFINGYIHDTQSTGVVSQQVQGTEVYGSIINYNGRQQVAEEGPGYGAYAQNVITNLQRKSFIDNIMAYNWSWGLHFYTEGATNDSMWAEGNAVYNSGLFWKVTTWSPQFLFQGPASKNRWFNFRNNYMYLGQEHGSGGHYFGLFGAPITNMTMTNNFMVVPGGGQAMSFDNDGGSNSVTNNVFVGNTPGLGSYTNNTFLSGWPATRADDIFVRRNKYELNRANIIAFNWNETSTISVNPNINGTVLNVGDTYVVKDGLNFWGNNVTTGTYNGGNITIPMTNLVPATPIGASTPPHTAPRFATFILIGSGLPQSGSAPVFTTQPQNRTVTVGQTASFTVAVNGSPTPTLQWQKNGVNIAGATGLTYTTPATTISDNGSTFRCVATNSQGTTTSNAATLTVNGIAPQFTQQPTSRTVNLGQSATFTVQISGNPTPTRQWQKNGINITGATGLTYITPVTTESDNGATFRCVATNSQGTVTSNSAALTVTIPKYDSVSVTSIFLIRKENTDTTVYPAVRVIKPAPQTPVDAYDPVTVLGTLFNFRRGCVDTTVYPPVRIQK